MIRAVSGLMMKKLNAARFGRNAAELNFKRWNYIILIEIYVIWPWIWD